MMLPDEWAQTRLGAHFKNSRTKGKEGLPTLSVTLNEGLVARDSLDRKMETSLAENEHLLVREGDIAYNMMRMWQGASGLAPYDAMVSPAYVVLRANKTIDPQFAAYLFKLPRMIYLFWAYSYGIAEDRLRLYFNDFSSIPLRLPPLAEQQRITEILLTWDQAIEKVGQLLHNAREQKRALMQQIFSRRRTLPGFTGNLKEIRLRDLGSCYNGVTYSPGDITDSSGLLVLRSSNIQRGRLVFDDNVYVSPTVKTSCLTRSGDILICVRNGSRDLIGKTARITDDAVDHAHGAFMSLFRSDEPEFAFQLFQTPEFERQVQQNLGATINSINTSNLLNFRFLVPDKAEREAIGNVLHCADAAINQLEYLRERTLKQKAALMQQLLTGKRRVNLDKKEAA